MKILFSFILLLAGVLSTAQAFASYSCSVVSNVWDSGYQLDVTVTNDGPASIDGWTVQLTFDEPANVTSSWNVIESGGNTATPSFSNCCDWNGNLAEGQSATFGIQGAHDGSFELPVCIGNGGPDGGSSSSSSSSSSSNSSSGSSSSSSSSSSSGGSNSINVRARGTTGSESITLSVGGTDVQSWTLGTGFMDFSVSTSLDGAILVEFTNDNDDDADVQVDYIVVNGIVREAEDQSENTGAWDGECGGGSNSEWLHCNGYINFGSVSGSGSSSSSSSSSSGGSGSAGCGLAPGLNSGRHSLNVGGLNREYIIDIPGNYDMNNPYRLVFAWHWRGGSADNVANDSYYNLKGLSNGTAIFVAPNRADGTDGWTNTNGRDMDFLRAMLDQFDNSLCIDQERIFSAGWSYGGMMSFAVGREMAETFRAIAPASGALWTPYSDSGLPMAAWITHGTSDSVVGFGSGEEARDLYVSANNCSNTTVPTGPASCVEYQNCDAGHPVVWCPFNGGHTTPSFYSTAVWDFFSRF